MGSANRAAKACNLSEQESASLLGIESGKEEEISAADAGNGEFSEDIPERVLAAVAIYQGLHSAFSTPLADRWIKRPNAGAPFYGRTSFEFMLSDGLPAMMLIRNHFHPY